MLKKDIGLNAGMIWRLLFDKGALSVRQIGELTGREEKMILYAIGWLAGENKIRFFSKREVVYIELIDCHSDIYY
ncbi:MAG: winged helix-turn-helix domain-containing protein [Dysgonamonadaceae bacterium]|jgi:hypothetical protein|nr:winged helix-turn-helix domain-containing protein [Dysgonamonadaceae bacterium]